MPTSFVNARLLTPDREIPDGVLVVEDQQIVYAGAADGAPAALGATFDLNKRTVSPGLIDIHVHGAEGNSFIAFDADDEVLEKYSRYAASRGVTGFLTSVAFADHAGYMRACRAYPPLFERGVSGAEPLGLHLEGPFLSLEKRATFPAHWLRTPSTQEMAEMLEAGDGWIRQMTMAPELPGAEEVARQCVEAGVVVALGHSNASYECAAKALAGRWSNVTHMYNAMSGLHHREPGVVGAVLHSTDGYVELIPDGIHAHPAAMQLVLERLGTDRVILISDATMAGLPDGEHDFGDLHIIVTDGVARIPAGNLAGSTIDMNRCVANACSLLGTSMQDAVRMASTNPARLLGLDDRLGRLETGMDASIVVLDADAGVALTMVRGEIVYDTGIVG